MPRSLPALALFILLGLITPLSQADDVYDYPFHAGFALGFVGADLSCDYYGYNCDGSDTGFRIHAGKRLHPNLGVEVAYHDLGKLTDRGTRNTSSAESTGINASLLGIIPVSEQIWFYGKVGYMWWDADYSQSNGTNSSESGSDMTYGAGLTLEFNQQYDLRFELERLNELGDDFVSGGATVTAVYIIGSVHF